MLFLKHQAERTFAKCTIEAGVDTDRIKRNAALLSDQLSPFKYCITLTLEFFHNTDDGSTSREISPTAANIEAGLF
jgi:hypothetical protein